MATVTELADRVCENTGLQTTGTERARVIQALNDTYKNAVRLADVAVAFNDYTPAANKTVHSLASDANITDAMRILGITLHHGSASAEPIRLQPVALTTIQDLRRRTPSTGTPSVYTILGLDKLFIHPTPTTSDTLTVWYVQRPPTLVESDPETGQETTPSLLPAEFHHSVLEAGATIQAFDTDSNDKALQWLDARYRAGIADLKDHVETFIEPTTLHNNAWDM